jgi:hypothetical protein
MGRPTYPKTLKEFRERFPMDEDCFKYLIESRWPEGMICPRCGGRKFWKKNRRWLHRCCGCKFDISPVAGTVLQGTHVPIQEWFWAAYLVATLTPGLSAKQLERQLGCEYRTAWYMMHRLRQAMVSDNRTKLYGIVEADECFIGGPSKGRFGRGVAGDDNKNLVFGAVEIIPWQDKAGRQLEKAGRLRLTIAEHADAQSIGAFLSTNVDPKTLVKTDGWSGYSKTALNAFYHEPKVGRNAPHIHQAFGNLKTWLKGTHHGVNPKYLKNYLDEFVFRFNRRKTPMAAFQTLLGISTAKHPIGLQNLISGARKT